MLIHFLFKSLDASSSKPGAIPLPAPPLKLNHGAADFDAADFPAADFDAESPPALCLEAPTMSFDAPVGDLPLMAPLNLPLAKIEEEENFLQFDVEQQKKGEFTFSHFFISYQCTSLDLASCGLATL